MTHTDKFRDTVGRKLDQFRARPDCTVSDIKILRLIDETLISETIHLFEKLEINEDPLFENSKSN